MTGGEKDCPDCPETQEQPAQAKAPGERGRVLVTGAGGFVGRTLCAALVDRGYKLRVLVRREGGDEFFKPLQAEIYTGDIRSREVVDWAMDGVDGVFHLASIVQQAGIPDRDFWDVHVTATGTIMEAALKYKVRRVVHCSTIGVLGHIANPPADETAPYNVEDIYQVTKAEAEKLALEYHTVKGVPVTVVRPAAVYGPGDRRLFKLFRLVSGGRFIMVGGGKTLIHPVFVDDLVEGMILAYESPEAAGQTYILGGEKCVSLREWVEIIAKAGGINLSVYGIPYAPIRLVSEVLEAVFKPLGFEPPLFRRRVDFFIKNRAFSIEKAKKELGYSPATTLEKGAEITWEWYRERGWIK